MNHTMKFNIQKITVIEKSDNSQKFIYQNKQLKQKK